MRSVHLGCANLPSMHRRAAGGLHRLLPLARQQARRQVRGACAASSLSCVTPRQACTDVVLLEISMPACGRRTHGAAGWTLGRRPPGWSAADWARVLQAAFPCSAVIADARAPLFADVASMAKRLEYAITYESRHKWQNSQGKLRFSEGVVRTPSLLAHLDSLATPPCVSDTDKIHCIPSLRFNCADHGGRACRSGGDADRLGAPRRAPPGIGDSLARSSELQRDISRA